MATWSYKVYVKINSLSPHHCKGRSMVYGPLLIRCTTESIRQILRRWKPLRKPVATLYNQNSSRHFLLIHLSERSGLLSGSRAKRIGAVSGECGQAMLLFSLSPQESNGKSISSFSHLWLHLLFSSFLSWWRRRGKWLQVHQYSARKTGEANNSIIYHLRFLHLCSMR